MKIHDKRIGRVKHQLYLGDGENVLGNCNCEYTHHDTNMIEDSRTLRCNQPI